MMQKREAKRLVAIFGKELALICVDEILKAGPYDSGIGIGSPLISMYDEWFKIKQEIQNKL